MDLLPVSLHFSRCFLGCLLQFFFFCCCFPFGSRMDAHFFILCCTQCMGFMIRYPSVLSCTVLYCICCRLDRHTLYTCIHPVAFLFSCPCHVHVHVRV